MNRRTFLNKLFSWALWGSIAGCFSWIFGSVWMAAGKFSTIHWSPVIDLDELPGDGTYPFPTLRIALIRSQDRLAALSLECTHLGCLVNVVGQGFFCPCHGSEFGPRGELYSGPATRPLAWHVLRIRAGQVWVQSGSNQKDSGWITVPRQMRGGGAS